MRKEQQTTLELTEYGLEVSLNLLNEPWRGRTQRTMFPEGLIRLFVIALFIALTVTISLMIYELYENSEVSRPSLGGLLLLNNNSD